MTSNPFVTIIIPTYHDWERLSLCINALEKQTYSKELFEVIIVNNDPKDNSPLNYYLPQNIKLVSEAIPGSYAARNKGLSLAKGEIYGFTDSDCIPNPDWIENAVKLFKTGKVDRIAGNIDFIYQDENRRTWIELYESIYEFDQERHVKVHKASVTANLFAKKDIFDKVGGFDLNRFSGDDFFWNERANAFNYNIVYGKNVTIKHPARSTFKEFKLKKRREFGGRKSYKVTGIKSIIKHVLYLPYLFYTLIIQKNLRLFFINKPLSFFDTIKIYLVNVYLFFILFIEYFRLMFKGAKVR